MYKSHDRRGYGEGEEEEFRYLDHRLAASKHIDVPPEFQDMAFSCESSHHLQSVHEIYVDRPTMRKCV